MECPPGGRCGRGTDTVTARVRRLVDAQRGVGIFTWPRARTSSWPHAGISFCPCSLFYRRSHYGGRVPLYQEAENHLLNPVIMSRTVKVSPLLILVSVLVGASLGNWLGGVFGAFVAALLAVPGAAIIQIVVKDVWQATDPALERPEASTESPETTTGP
jgi:hypothetical protein